MPTLRSLRRAVLHGVTGALTLWFVAACATAAPPSTTPPPTPNPPSGATIEFVSERSVVLPGPGASARLEAVVVGADGTVDASAQVTWHAADDGVASVAADGTVTAHAALGATLVIASHGDLAPQAATVVVAQLHPGTRAIESDDVLSSAEDGSEVVLRRHQGTETIEIGDVVMSGERAGVLVRVLGVAVQTDTVTLQTEEAGLPDAFARLSVDLTGPATSFDVEVVDVDGETLVLQHVDGVVAHFVEGAGSITCKAEDLQMDVPLRITKFRLQLDVNPRMRVEVEEVAGGGSEAILIELVAEAIGSYELAFADLRIGVRKKFDCKVTAPRIALPPFLIGPVPFGLGLTPAVGVEVEGEFEGVELRAYAPGKQNALHDRIGVRWTREDGLEGVWASEPTSASPATPEPFSWDDYVASPLRFKAKVEPFLEFVLDDFYAIGLVRVKSFVGARVRLESPFSKDAYGFVGPDIEAYFGVQADLKPLLKDIQAAERLMRRLLGRDGAGSLLNLEIILYDFKGIWGASPIPSIQVSRDLIDAENPTVTFSVDLPASAAGGLRSLLFGQESWVGVYGFRDAATSEPVLLGTGTIPQVGGSVPIEWTPTSADTGLYEVFAVAGSEFGFWRFGTPTPVVVEVALDPKVSVRLDPPMTFFDPRFAPAGSIGVFDLVNDGDEVSFTVSNVNEHVHLIGPVAGVLPAGERVSVAYAWTCPEPATVTYGLTLGFSIDGAPAGGDVPPLFTFSIECVDRPPPPCEGENCEPGGGGPDGGGSVDAGGLTGRSWGDPHLVTLDGRPYDFHASGDYILSSSTDPDDDFEVQVRYRALRPGDPWFRDNPRISVGFGVAARVVGDVVNVIVNGQGLFEVYVDGALVQVGGNLDLQLPSRGTVQLRGTIATITWPDLTSLTLSSWRARQLRFDYLEDIRLYVPTARFGQIEGLLGDADGDPLNDVRVRGGEVLEVLDPAVLYGAFRDSWRVPFGTAASLFAFGPDPFDPDFPGSPASLSDFTAAERDAARVICEAAGVVSHAILQACMLDVLVTGDDDVAADAVLADPATPTVTVTPALAYVYPGSQRFFGAVVSGAPELRAEWSASGGTLEVLNDVYVRFTAPDEPGAEIDLSAWLSSDDRVTGQARVIVLDLACGSTPGFDRSWLGGVDGVWSNPSNWLPAGAPGSGESAFVCADPTHAPRLTANAAVGDLVMAPGASLRLGTSTLAVHGALMLPGGGVLVESGALEVVGDGATLSGSLPALTIRAPTTAVDPVSFAGRLTIAGGRFDPAGHAVTVGEDLRTSGQGCLVMQSANDHVTVAGAAVFAGSTAQSPACPMEAGTLELQGNVSVSGSNFSRLTPGAGHRALLSGAVPQVVSFSGVSVGHSQGNRFHDLTIANAAGVTFASDVDVRGELRFQGGSGTVDGDVTVHVGGDLVEPAGGDRWRVATTELRGADRAASLPATLHGNLAVRMATTLSGPEVIHGALTVAAPVTLSGALEVIGDLAIGAGANGRLDPAGHALSVGGDLRTSQFGCLVMVQAGGHVLVAGDALFGGSTAQVPACSMTAGTLELRGDVSVSGSNFSRLTPASGHRMLLSGAGPQAVSFSGVALGHSQGNRFHDLTVANAAGVTFATAIDVRGELDLVGRLTNQGALTIAGRLTLRSASYLDGAAGSIALASGDCVVEPGAGGVGWPPACGQP